MLNVFFIDMILFNKVLTKALSVQTDLKNDGVFCSCFAIKYIRQKEEIVFDNRNYWGK